MMKYICGILIFTLVHLTPALAQTYTVRASGTIFVVRGDTWEPSVKMGTPFECVFTYHVSPNFVRSADPSFASIHAESQPTYAAASFGSFELVSPSIEIVSTTRFSRFGKSFTLKFSLPSTGGDPGFTITLELHTTDANLFDLITIPVDVDLEEYAHTRFKVLTHDFDLLVGSLDTLEVEHGASGFGHSNGKKR